MKWTITYFFTSTSAYGDEYTRSILVTAKTRAGAESLAKLEGFKAFGHLFNDNCFDWQIESA